MLAYMCTTKHAAAMTVCHSWQNKYQTIKTMLDLFRLPTHTNQRSSLLTVEALLHVYTSLFTV